MNFEKLANWFSKALNFMSTANNIVQFIVFIMAVVALFYIFSFKYIKPIIKLLYPIGIKRRIVFLALFLCRKNPRKYIRIFCEFNILKSQGQHRNKIWWKNTYKEFIAFFKDSSPDNFIYEVDNCTDILCEEIFNLINDYFDYFDKEEVRKKYDLNRKLPISFCLNIRIKQGFLSPNFLLSGLLDRYKNNWGNLVKKYISCANNEKYTDPLYASEIYYTFAWLLWGPSYQLKHQEGNYKLCQYAFGDESNSINVVLNNKKELIDLWKKITINSNGEFCSLTFKLYKAKNYISFYRNDFNPLNTYFTNKVADESTGFLIEPIAYDIEKNYMALNYYCTAYVWIMFESINDDNDCFQPQRAITFFEHANLANQINYEACINSLVTKSFDHFDRMLSNNSIIRKYRYCLSMNYFIEKRFLERYELKTRDDCELSQKYKECLILDKTCAESEVFNSFDSYFCNTDDDFSLIEVSTQNKQSIAQLGEYYTSIYIDSFSDINERESLESIIDYLNKKNKGWYGNNNYHILLAAKSDKIIGGLICDYFDISNCGIIEFIAIKEEYQSQGIGTKLYQKAIDILRKDSIKNKKKGINYMFCEIEKIKEINEAHKYIFFWDKMGYKKLEFDYIQPALESSKKEVSTLNLIALQTCSEIQNQKGISVIILKNFLFDYAKYAMRIEDPQNDEYIIKMIQSIDALNKKDIKLNKIIMLS